MNSPKLGRCPIEVEVGDEAWCEQQIERTLSNLLPGDVNVAVPGIVGLRWSIRHGVRPFRSRS